MNGGISAPFIRLPVATTLIMVAILLAGAVAYPLLPVAPLPQIDFPTIAVSASLPGGTPWVALLRCLMKSSQRSVGSRDSAVFIDASCGPDDQMGLERGAA